VATFTVVVTCGVCVLVPVAMAVRKPDPDANASDPARIRTVLLGTLTRLYFHAFLESDTNVLNALLTALLVSFPLTLQRDPRSDHGCNPSEERAPCGRISESWCDADEHISTSSESSIPLDIRR